MPPQFIEIDDPDAAAIANYRNLKDRDLRALSGEDSHQGCFILEGLTVIEKALSAPLHPVLSLLIAENRKERVAPLVEASGFDGPVYVAGRAVLDSITGFPVHRGILGLGARPVPIDTEELIRMCLAEARPSLFLVLSGIANHDNLGGLFRNAAAFGVQAVLLDRACCDPLYRKAIRVSVGGTVLVPFARDDTTIETIDTLRAHDVRCLALATDGSTDLTDIAHQWDTSVALVAGPEGSGLDTATIKASVPVRIPMAKGFDSLNVATAAGIALHWLTHAR